ncbi:putative colanic acid biosynthesis acetyltransferase [Thioclava sp. BHET1]|nr:putative colanic acid biosynthesis acetyltransferase [Thioclava sp. BHET1]
MTVVSPTSRIERTGFGGRATFGLGNRLFRLFWALIWLLLARWTPPQMRGWRRLLLRLFGAQIHGTAGVRGSARIWYPPHLKMGPFASIGPGVNCYNQGRIEIGAYTVISQGAYLCTGTHDINAPEFHLLTRPISIGANAWICAEAFVGPGVSIGDGAVLSARGAAFRNLDAWTVYQGNPAAPVKPRPQFERPLP